MIENDTYRSRNIVDVPVDFPDTKIRIAMIQLKSAAEEKQLVDRDDGRKSFDWPASKSTDFRIKKIVSILEWLYQNEPDIKLVVFPEYSFPVRRALTEIQRIADQYGVTIVAGSDSFTDEKSGTITNKCPVIRPSEEIVWITKQFPSLDESQFLTPSNDEDMFRFIWTVGNKPYWFVVYICLDFLTCAMPDVYLNNMQGPGLFITPMCSKVMTDFYLLGAILHRVRGGTVTLLCNGVDNYARGGSAICTVHGGSNYHEPSLQLPNNNEAIAIFDLDFTQLTSQRPTPLNARSAVSNSRILRFECQVDGRLMTHSVEPEHSDKVVRGVINPALYHAQGKFMRVAFLDVKNYANLKDRVKNLWFETLAVLGHSDLVVTHIHQYASYMHHHIVKDANITLRNEQRSFNSEQSHSDPFDGYDDAIPHFEVENYFKVLGVTTNQVSTRISKIPLSSDLSHIVALGNDWYDPNIPNDFRTLSLKNKWIIAKTENRPGDISAIISIELTGENESRMSKRIRDFQNRILPKITNAEVVTSCFGGTGHLMDCHFLLRVTTRVEKLFEFVENLHKWAEESIESILTRTYVVVNKLSDLELNRVLTTQSLPASLAGYAMDFFTSHLSPENTLKFESLPIAQQTEIIEIYRGVEQKTQEVQPIPDNAVSGNWSKDRCRKTLSNGILNFFYPIANSDDRDQGILQLKELHDYFQSRVETLLTHFIKKNVTDQDFAAMKDASIIQSQKTIAKLTYAEKIKVCCEVSKSKPELTDYVEQFLALDPTIRCRNIITHSQQDETNELIDYGFQNYCLALMLYLSFLEKYWLKKL